MKAMRCDQCGYVQDDEGLFGWLHIDQQGIEVRRFGSVDITADLCSVECVREYVARKAVQMAGVPREPRGAVSVDG